MKRGFLRWFYVGVQFVMLAVSIPKVATLFHAYDTQTMGPLVAGLDMRSWLVGIAIDLTATFTTWAAMAKYDESRKRTALLAPAFIILFCTALSVIANYEDAATRSPLQYTRVMLFSNPAVLINPVLISAPPVLVLLLIMLVPSVLAQPRLKSAEEIAATADEQEAMIAANARVREAKARANARVRGAQLSGFVDTMGAVIQRGVSTESAPSEEEEPLPPDDNGSAVLALPERLSEPDDSTALPLANAHVSKAMWQSLGLKERVMRSGVISVQEVAEVLGLSLTRARELVKEVRGSNDGNRTVPGRSGVTYTALIDALYV